jgi:hypothetical protein
MAACLIAGTGCRGLTTANADIPLPAKAPEGRIATKSSKAVHVKVDVDVDVLVDVDGFSIPV